MPECAECGESFDEGYAFCPHCGADLDADRSARETAVEGGQWGRPTSGVAGSGPSRHRGTATAETADGRETDDASAQRSSDADADRRSPGAESDRASADSATDRASTEAGAADGETSDPDGSTSQIGPGTDRPEADRSTADRAGDDRPRTDVDGPSPFDESALSFASTYAVRDGYESLVLGSLVHFCTVVFVWTLIVPFLGFLVGGYCFRLARAAARGQTDPPGFDDYGDAFVDGLKLASLGLVFSLAFVVPGGVATVIGVLVHEYLAYAVAGGWFLAASYGFPAAMAAYAATDEFEHAFAPEYAAAFATTTTYLKAYLVWVGVSLLLVLLALAALLTVVGFFVVATWAAYFSAAYWSYYYREAVADGDVPTPPADAV